MCFRINQLWHCHQEHRGCMGKLNKLTKDKPIPSQLTKCEQATITGQQCVEVTVIQQHLALCCSMHHSRRIRQLEELWKDEWKNQVFDHFARKQHLSDREKADWQRASNLQETRWNQFQERLEPLYTQFGNRLNAAVVGALRMTFYERIEQTMLAFVESVRRQCIIDPENREHARREAAAAAAVVAAVAGGLTPLIPPRSSRRRQRSTSVQQHDLPNIQNALVEISLSGPAGDSASAQTRPLPTTPTPAAQAGPSSALSVLGHEDDATITAITSVVHAFRDPSPALSSDESGDSESEDETTLLSKDM